MGAGKCGKESCKGCPSKGSAPDMETLMEWDEEGGCEALDGCWVEPDGHCKHGCPSWMLAMGMI